MELFKLSDSSEPKGSQDTKRCPNCLADIPREAKRCSHCGSKQKVHLTKKHITAIFLVMISFILMIVSLGDSDSNSSSSAQTEAISDIQAHIMAEKYVEHILKSPSTADFPAYDYRAFDLGDNKYKIVSYVDAQNTFGATARSDWSVILSYKGGEWSSTQNWVLHELIFDGELVYTESTSTASAE